MKFVAGWKRNGGRRAHQERNQFLHTLLLEGTTPSRIHTCTHAYILPTIHVAFTECVENASIERFRARVCALFRSVLLSFDSARNSESPIEFLSVSPTPPFKIFERIFRRKIYIIPPPPPPWSSLQATSLNSRNFPLLCSRPTCGAALTQLQPTSGGTDRHLHRQLNYHGL